MWYEHLGNRAIVLGRYAVSACDTFLRLVRMRPGAIVVTQPPIVAALVAMLYGRLTRTPVLLDSHPQAFGRKGNRVWRALLPLHAALARRARVNLVASENLADVVRSWGARVELFHEAPPLWPVVPPAPLRPRPRVLWVSIFAQDEPLDEVLAAAHRLPDVDFQITGNVVKLSPETLARAPENVEFVGLRWGPAYGELVAGADVLLVLTTERGSVPRAAYEAVYARRPLVVTDGPELNRFFPFAVPVRSDADGIARGVREALDRYDELVERADEAAAVQAERWRAQLARIATYLDAGPPRGR